MHRVLGTLLAALILLAAPAQAQRKCVKGKPCGNTCIAMNKTCRIGAPAPQPAPPPTARPAPDTALSSADTIAANAPWVASSQGQVYYRRGCSSARRLSPANLIYFKTEDDARKAGYRRSTTRGC